MKILVSGSSGLVGSALVAYLRDQGHTVVRLVRQTPAEKSEPAIVWNPETGRYNTSDCEGFDVVINLAGENIATRWNNTKKQKILESRVKTTRLLSECLAKLENPPRLFINASAVGFYGNHGTTELTEQTPPGEGFLADVCKQWEEATMPAQQRGIRVAILRIGTVLSPKGGALSMMLPAFKMGAGGKIGSGKQYISWIVIDDLLRIVSFLIDNDACSGPFNVVSPNPVTNEEFTETLGRVVSRPTMIPMPAMMAKLMFGEMADEVLLTSIRAMPYRLQHAGFGFQHPRLEEALQSIIKEDKV